jgi:hypothetical protein
MKKKLLIVLIVLAGLLLVYIGINQVDAGEPVNGFTRADLPSRDFSRNNGFYRLFSLSMADDVDIESGEVLEKIRKLNDPAFDNDQFLAQWKTKEYLAFARKRLGMLKEKVPNRGNAWLNHPENGGEDWLENILPVRGEVDFMKAEMRVWLERYQKLIDSPVFVDFSRLHFETPIPNLLAWLITAKLYNVLNMLDAIDGNWERGVGNILAQINLVKRSQKGSLVMITNLVGKAIGTHSLRALATLMNRKDCPESVYKQILEGLPPITYEEFGTRNSFVAESIFTLSNFKDSADGIKRGGNVWQKLMKALFLQKNRTHQQQINMMRYLIEMEQTPPYQWKEPLKPLDTFASGWFWWLQNPVGKKWLDYMAFPSQAKVITKSYRLKAYYDTVRISAELHLNYSAEKSVEEILASLETYKTVDACSGKPYRWNEQKQVLYSIGTNRIDDGGIEEFKTHQKDFIVPCVLYIK